MMGRLAIAAIMGVTLAGCGGGGGGSAATPVTPAPLVVTVSTATVDVTSIEGAGTTFGFIATSSGTAPGPVVPDVQITGQRVVLAAPPTATTPGRYDIRLRAADFLPGGQGSTEVTFRLCADPACASVYPNTTQKVTVNLTVALKDWATFQRDASHTAYVPVRYSTAAFAPAWSVPSDSGRPTAVAATTGSVFANFPQSSAILRTKAIAATSGAVRWEYDLGVLRFYSAPSFAGGRVVSAAMDMSSGTLPMQVLDASTGRNLWNLTYASQFARAGAPVPIGDKLFLLAGYFGNVVYGYDAAAGTKDWEKLAGANFGGVSEGASVAVDESRVYFYRADALYILNRATGEVLETIADPFFSRAGLSYFGTYYGAPILGPGGRIYTFSDNRGPTTPSAIIAFETGRSTHVWRTALTYVGAPALRGNRLYAPRAGTNVIDAIDTATGQIAESITVAPARIPLTSNIVVTESHLFVATDAETYAVDLAQTGNPVVWSVAQGGDLAVTPDNLLVVSSRMGIFAYRLA